MTREDEYAFVAAFSSAMRHSADLYSLDKLWRDYSPEIEGVSREGRIELERLRARRSTELTGKGAA